MVNKQISPRTKTVKMQVKDLIIHPEAQRAMIQSHLRDIKQTMDLDAIGTIHAVQYARDGKPGTWVVDGQHRIQALLDLEFGDWEVQVVIHLDVKTDAQASSLFLKLNRRKGVYPFDTFKNEVTSGKIEATQSYLIVQKLGLDIKSHSGDHALNCVNTIKKIWALDSGKSLKASLSMLLSAWGTRSEALEGKLVEGLGIVYHKYDGSIQGPILQKRLAKYPGGPSALLGDAKGLRGHQKIALSRAVAQTIISTYNVGLRTGRLDPL